MARNSNSNLRNGKPAGRRPGIGLWVVLGLVCSGGVFAAYHYVPHKTIVEVQVAKARKGDFTLSVRTRGEIRSSHSEFLIAPQVPDPHIVKLAESGKPVKKGDVVVEFDAAQ